MTQTTPPVFIINMNKDTERRETMRRRAEAVGLKVEFVAAVNGREMTAAEIEKCYDSAKRKRYFGRDMTIGEIGCLMSHRSIYERIVAEKVPYAVILEDDVLFESDIAEALAGIPKAPIKWDVIRFLSHSKVYKRGFRRIIPLGSTRYQFARSPAAPGGAYGYFISYHAAEEMLRHMQRNWLPVDVMLGRVWETGLEMLLLVPPPLRHDASCGSTIGGERFDKYVDLNGVARVMYFFTRAWFKLSENCGKRWIYYSNWFRDRNTTETYAGRYKR